MATETPVRLRYTADFDLPAGTTAEAQAEVKEQFDSIALSIVRGKDGTITVSPTNGALATRSG